MAAHDNTNPDQFREQVWERHRSGDFFQSHEIAAMTPDQYKTVIEASGGMQRGRPERAMDRAQEGKTGIGGGIYTTLMENVGDLTNRIGAHGGYDVSNKIRRSLGALQHPYGAKREMNEQAVENARYHGRSVEEQHGRIQKYGDIYAEEHMNVPVYTKPMELGRNAALALGMRHFNKTEEHLTSLQNILGEEGTTGASYKRAMSQEASVKYLQGREARGRGRS